MADLNEHHRRKILTTIMYADELLSESLDLLGSSGGALCPSLPLRGGRSRGPHVPPVGWLRGLVATHVTTGNGPGQ